MRNNKRLLGVALVAGIGIILLIVLAVKLGGKSQQSQETEMVSAGIAYLEAQEAKSPEQVDEMLRQYRQEKLESQRDELMRQVRAGEISVWSLFDDYVILGDSRAVGFWTYEFLPEERVLAEGGGTIRKLQEHIPEIVTLSPARVFLCYGLNDVSIGYWDTPEEYVAEYKETISELRAELPNLEIYISSILPANETGLELEPSWAEIPAFSEAVRAMCEEIGCYYVDNDEICTEHADLWNADGIHVGRAFYQYWAENLIEATYTANLDLVDQNEENQETSPDQENPDTVDTDLEAADGDEVSA